MVVLETPTSSANTCHLRTLASSSMTVRGLRPVPWSTGLKWTGFSEGARRILISLEGFTPYGEFIQLVDGH